MFCPRCGADNRPPAARPHSDAHEHNYIYGQRCIHCGECVSEPYAFGRRVRLAASALCALLGVLVGGLALIVYRLSQSGGGRIGLWVRSWYGGGEANFILGAVAVGLVGLSVWMLLKLPLSQSRWDHRHKRSLLWSYLLRDKDDDWKALQ
jgi:hypothetical protein